MKVAVLSLTRDRLDYTKHCFKRLRELAGCPYDHYVLDQGSEDGTPDWLSREYPAKWLELLPGNIGISKALNILLDQAQGYDVVVKFDNDCEVLTQDVLRETCALVNNYPDMLLSPVIHGLNAPPQIQHEVEVDEKRIGVTGAIGGIFLAANANVYETFRHNPGNPSWGMDDVNICEQVGRNGGTVGYVLDHHANHFETTEGQKATYPEYWARKHLEFYGREE